MADQDINFRLNTEADTSGAEEATEALKDTRTEAQKLQAQRDVETVQRQRAEADAKREAEVLREIADAQQRIVAANLAKVIGEVAGQFKGLNPDLDQALSGLTNFLTVYAASGNVYGAIGAVAAQSVFMVFDAIEAGNKIFNKGLDDLQQATKRLTEATARRGEEARKAALEEKYEREIELLKEQTTLVERLNDLQAAGRKTDANVQEAINPAASPDDQVRQERSLALNDVNQRLAEAEAAAEAAAQLALTAQANAQVVASQANVDKARLKEAELAAEKAQIAAETAQAKAERLKAEKNLAVQEIDAAAVQGFRDAAAESTKTITKQAEQTLAEIQAVADANEGGDLATKAALQRIAGLLKDGQISETEVKDFEGALKLAQASTTAIRTGLSQRLTDDIELARQIEEANKARDAETKSLLKEIASNQATHKRDLDELRAMVRAGSGSGY